MEVLNVKKILRRIFRRKPKAIVIHNHDKWLEFIDRELNG